MKLVVEGAAQPGSSGPAKPRQQRAKPVKDAPAPASVPAAAQKETKPVEQETPASPDAT